MFLKVFLSSPPVRLGLLDFSVSSSPLLPPPSSPPSFFIITIINIINIINIITIITSSSSSSSFTATTNGFCTLPIYIRTAHVFFSLLATTGAASVPHLRRLFLEFCEKVILFVIVAKICNGKIKGLAIHV